MKPVLLIDNYDSFTHMLADYLRQKGGECEVIRNDDTSLMGIQPDQYSALVISPGPGRPKDAGMLMQVLPRFIGKLPVLGICLGQQAIGEFYGAQLVHASKPRHGKVDEMEHYGHPIFETVPQQFFATRYHSLVLNEIPDCLEVICTCNQEVMGLAHRQLPVYGLQFHPESCCTPEGITMILNFLHYTEKAAI